MTRLLRRATMAGAILIAVLAAAPASAGALRCRTDPTVLLSNGTVLDLSADIDAWLWDVSSVAYTIHVPVGVKAVLVLRTPNWPTTKETFTIVADGPRGYYDTKTVVRTGQKTVAVTANLLVNLQYASVNGSSGQPIFVAIQTP